MVNLFLGDTEFYKLFPDINLVSATYNKDTFQFDCVFEVPKTMRNPQIYSKVLFEGGPPVLVVQRGWVWLEKTYIYDWRLSGMTFDAITNNEPEDITAEILKILVGYLWDKGIWEIADVRNLINNPE
jgi:hypothetical protein